jgi:hypothetical protein
MACSGVEIQCFLEWLLAGLRGAALAMTVGEAVQGSKLALLHGSPQVAPLQRNGAAGQPHCAAFTCSRCTWKMRLLLGGMLPTDWGP